jgi:hypothetical protein
MSCGLLPSASITHRSAVAKHDLAAIGGVVPVDIVLPRGLVAIVTESAALPHTVSDGLSRGKSETAEPAIKGSTSLFGRSGAAQESTYQPWGHHGRPVLKTAKMWLWEGDCGLRVTI